jgi:two-component system OmpR family sensor kinase
MAVALPLAPVHQTVRQLAVLEVSGGAAVLVLLGVFARLLLARGMRPLEQITVTATAIADGDLDRRVPVSGPDARVRRTEVGRLTLAVNGMLARIQDALGARARSEERLRRFVADASHELRTPLTSIRGYLQLLRHGIVAATGAPDMLRRADEEAVRMASIVDDLLYLARLDAEPALRHDRVDLVMVVRESLADALAVEPGRPATLAVPEECPVFGDEDALRQVMANLLANVRTHTPAGTPVEVRLTRTDAVARVEVVDHGPGIPTDVAQRAFDRFSRGDTGRGSGGSGLGLAIVAEILTAHRGEVHLESAVGAGTTVWFTVPMTDS